MKRKTLKPVEEMRLLSVIEYYVDLFYNYARQHNLKHDSSPPAWTSNCKRLKEVGSNFYMVVQQL